MQVAVQRAIARRSLGYFHTMSQRCRAKAASARDPDDQAYWLGLAQIWSKLAERDEQ
jgi:hypothetical protein